MTITINFLEIFRVIFIIGWSILAGVAAWIGIEDFHFNRGSSGWLFSLGCVVLCIGSAAMLYLGR